MNIRICISLVFLLFVSAKNAENYPQDYFTSPIDFTISLSGNFGDFRTNHFHSGIDIRTQGVIGKKIYASAEGFISRIRISPYGYGNALYIEHPNGYTTLYGHLNKFNKSISEYIFKKQYELELNTIDYYLEPGELKVEQGDIIAFGGNSGSSSGPHLHFEIRDTKTEHPLNPIMFGFNIPDDVLPEIYSIYVYPLDDWSSINGKNKVQSFNAFKFNGVLHINDRIEVSGKIGIGLYSLDRFKNGKYKHTFNELLMKVDGQDFYKFKYSELDFKTLRDVNSHMDLERKITEKKKITKCFKEPDSRLAFYSIAENNGVLELFEGEKKEIEIQVKDLENNKSKIVFKLHGRSDEVRNIDRKEYDKKLNYDKENSYFEEGVSLYFPENRLYKDINLIVDFSEEKNTVNVGPEHTALKDWYTLKIKCPNYPEDLRDKLIIAKDRGNSYRRPEYTSYDNGWLSCRTKEFGKFQVVLDTIAPRVELLSKSIGNSKTTFKVSDNFNQFSNYEAKIDNRWLKLYFDAKAKKFYCNPSDLELEKGEHELIFEISDPQGNKGILNKKFTL